MSPSCLDMFYIGGGTALRSHMIVVVQVQVPEVVCRHMLGWERGRIEERDASHQLRRRGAGWGLIAKAIPFLS